jgi:hypothetical protein
LPGIDKQPQGAVMAANTDIPNTATQNRENPAREVREASAGASKEVEDKCEPECECMAVSACVCMHAFMFVFANLSVHYAFLLVCLELYVCMYRWKVKDIWTSQSEKADCEIKDTKANEVGIA